MHDITFESRLTKTFAAKDFRRRIDPMNIPTEYSNKIVRVVDNGQLEAVKQNLMASAMLLHRIQGSEAAEFSIKTDVKPVVSGNEILVGKIVTALSFLLGLLIAAVSGAGINTPLGGIVGLAIGLTMYMAYYNYKEKKSAATGENEMKKLIIAISISAIIQSSHAGTVAGFGGSTEYTQIINMTQLILQYSKQIDQYVMQAQQYDAQLKNLMSNPNSTMSTAITGMIQQIGGMMSAGNAMGGSLATIDAKFATTFASPIASNYSQQFSNLTKASKDTLQGSMRTAGLQRDQFATDTNALQALYAQSQNTNGALDSLQTLSQINIKNVQQLQGLKDLMATQNIAASTWMAAQTSKGQAAQDRTDAIQAAAIATLPATPTTLSNSPQTYNKWNLYISK